jgi:hypothetical protein
MIDNSNMLGVLEDFPNQIHKGFFELSETLKAEGDFNKIVFAWAAQRFPET